MLVADGADHDQGWCTRMVVLCQVGFQVQHSLTCMSMTFCSTRTSMPWAPL